VSPADAVSRPSPLAPKIIGEVRELHERTLQVTREARGRRGRRERREAKEAEADLLRALGFASYEAFVAVVDGKPAAEVSELQEPLHEPPELSLVETPDRAELPEPLVLDAQQTEAALLRVLHNEGRTVRPRPTLDDGAEPMDGGESDDLVEDLHARVAAFEEELAEARFELRRLRDELRSRPESSPVPEVSAPGERVDPGEGVREAAAGLVAAAAELRSLCELLRGERGELAALGVTARAEAERVLDAARVDARRERDAAAVEARAVLDQARAEAVALTRNAISTVDGLRQLAAEERGSSGDEL
jgi:hypothetical protein